MCEFLKLLIDYTYNKLARDTTNKTDQRCNFETQLKCGKTDRTYQTQISVMSVCLSASQTHTLIFRHLIYTSVSACLLARSSLSYPSISPISKAPIQSTSPKFSYSWCFMLFILLSSSLLFFPILSQIFSRFFMKINYNISYEYFVTPTCARCMVVHVTDTVPWVHVY
jgi:hypothetical protein